MSDWQLVERRLDALVRPSMVVDPPPAVQAALLATVLRAADAHLTRPASAPIVVSPGRPLPVGLPTIGYAAVAALIAAYAALVGMSGGLGQTWDWVPVLVAQLAASATLLGGPSGDPLLGALLDRLGDQVVWLGLVPLLWVLWERDRAALGEQ